MKTLSVQASRGKGILPLPPSKSHTQRALLFALMAEGTSIIHTPLPSPDTEAMLAAIEQLGAKILYKDPKVLHIQGCGGNLCSPTNIIDAGNSGLVLRFIGVISSLLPTYTVLTGDASIRNNRPVRPMLEAIKQLGGFGESLCLNDTAPVVIKGPIKPGFVNINGQCSQAVSALLIACSFLPSASTIVVEEAGEKPFLELTLSWLDFFNLGYKHQNLEHFTVMGGGKINGFEVQIPSDMSSLAFPLAAALVTDSSISFENLDTTNTQGDAKIIQTLKQLGAHLEYSNGEKNLYAKGKQILSGGVIDVNAYIDALPILSVLGCLGKEPLTLVNGAIARKKECDRIRCMTLELRKMGAIIEEKEDGMTIFPSRLQSAVVSSHKDHRVAMALAIAGLTTQGTTVIEDVECIQKSYPGFVEDLRQLGFLAAEK